ncbi:KRAB-A domain-containing protein 2 [Trichinella sp. T8]|nr:KRAB-A domain-containing protein 2 [Trichinella sp. T8]
MITDILRIQSDGPKSARDYNLKNRYGVLKIGEENKLIRLGKNEAIRCIVSIEEMFDVINDAHQKIGHEAQNKWANVTQEACHLFLTFCEECHKKRARKLPKSLVVKPLVSTNLMSRAQVDLINFQTMPDVPDTEIPLRTAVTKATGGQGYVKCMCLSGCSSGRCSCSRKRVFLMIVFSFAIVHV